jgi:hypothetical protein
MSNNALLLKGDFMSQSQKEAVFSAVTSVVNESGLNVAEGTDYSNVLTKEHRAQITSILVEGFRSESISLDKSFEDESALRTYCSGLTSNWLRKDKRLNGGMKYVAKNPGSRVGSSDPQLKAMRILLSTQVDQTKREEIQAFIDARIASIKTSNKPAKTINVADLPSELQYLAE